MNPTQNGLLAIAAVLSGKTGLVGTSGIPLKWLEIYARIFIKICARRICSEKDKFGIFRMHIWPKCERIVVGENIKIHQVTFIGHRAQVRFIDVGVVAEVCLR